MPTNSENLVKIGPVFSEIIGLQEIIKEEKVTPAHLITPAMPEAGQTS